MKKCMETGRPYKRRILFFGDSNTYGYDPGVPLGGRYGAEIRWTDRLAGALKDSWEILPYGLNGRCIPDLRYEKTYLDRMLENAGNIDIFAVMLGTNDVFLSPHPDAGKAARKADAFLAYLCDKQAFRPLLIAPPAVDRTAAAMPEWSVYVNETAALPACYKDLAEKYRTLFVNADAWEIGMGHDFVHFSEDGHRRFAEKMEEYLNSL